MSIFLNNKNEYIIYLKDTPHSVFLERFNNLSNIEIVKGKQEIEYLLDV